MCRGLARRDQGGVRGRLARPDKGRVLEHVSPQLRRDLLVQSVTRAAHIARRPETSLTFFGRSAPVRHCGAGEKVRGGTGTDQAEQCVERPQGFRAQMSATSG